MNNQEMISYRLDRAKSAIFEAEKMAEIKHWNTCINRLYYACFYAATALLSAYNLGSSKHSGVRGLFNQHFIKTSKLPKSIGRLFNKLFIYRQQSDYEDLFFMDESNTLPLISETKEFVNIIEDELGLLNVD